MKVLVITTGGTIGSAFNGAAIDVCDDGRCAAAERYAAEHQGIQFDIKSPLNILSEQLTADDLNRLAKAVWEAEITRYDGVIVTVGSDNLAYLSALIGLLFGDCGVPICSVASDKVLSDEKANGYANFCCAVGLIRRGKAGAFVPYRGTDGVMVVHAATDLRQADLSDDFVSFHGAYGVWKDGVLIEKRPYIRQTIPAVFDKAHLPQLEDNVLLIHPYPMQAYARLNTDGVRAVLHTLYHSGTLDARGAAQWAESLGGVPLYLASLRSGRKVYATTAEAIRRGAIPLYDIAPECAYMKLLLACAQARLGLRDFMEGIG